MFFEQIVQCLQIKLFFLHSDPLPIFYVFEPPRHRFRGHGTISNLEIRGRMMIRGANSSAAPANASALFPTVAVGEAPTPAAAAAMQQTPAP
mmetsp:Transcript_4851/g.8277  ORF Transcript_4851/g.8277 Transcript_4851/m.8277 type:complete len:92 (+) Transcript_4851:125-400(+)